MAIADEYNIKPGKHHLPVERPIYFSGDPFGDHIRKRRIHLGLSLRDVERRTGIGNARISRWERGEQRPETADLLAPLAEALDVPLADLCKSAGPGICQGLPHVTPYLHLKYGQHLPSAVLDDLVAHCERILAQHAVGSRQANAAT